MTRGRREGGRAAARPRPARAHPQPDPAPLADRYWGSFPKVGIVVPNAASWLLPDFADLFGPSLNATLRLPGPGAGLPAGARAEPDSDGFVIWLPSSAF